MLEGGQKGKYYFHHSKIKPSTAESQEVCICKVVPQKTRFTLPETNSSPLKIGHPKRKLVFQPSISGAMLVSGSAREPQSCLFSFPIINFWVNTCSFDQIGVLTWICPSFAHV